jgi:hypothetical protein
MAQEEHSLKHFSVPVSSAVALAAGLTLASVSPARADEVTPPPVPAEIRVPEGNSAYFMGHAEGTQNYLCVPKGDTFDWALSTPQATLFNGNDKQVATHFFSPNPFEGGTVRAAWLHSRDSSVVWGKAAKSSSDPAYVEPGAIAWLLVEVQGAGAGPTGGDTLTSTTFIHRVNTSGGLKPSTGCSGWDNVGAMQYVPYAADYYFYAADEAE